MTSQIHFNEKLHAFLKTSLKSTPPCLIQAIEYVLFSGGKRIRPTLVYAAGQTLGAPLESLDAPAIAVECLHTYSLVHDDLPAMDDDDLRRGQPTCHIKFDEATAILTGDALLTLAFEALSTPTINPIGSSLICQQIQILASYTGSKGMVAGQSLDCDNINTTMTQAQLEKIHDLKTGKLIQASLILGALAGNANNQLIEQFKQLGKLIGLAFQVQDDYLERTQSTEQLGKSNQSDLDNQKTTYVDLLGIEGTENYLNSLFGKTKVLIEKFEKPEFLMDFLKQMHIRKH